MTDATEDNLRRILHVSFYQNEPYDKLSIMEFGTICEHDSGLMCECRLNFFIDFLKELE